MLTIAQDLVSLITPYQQSLNTVLDAAISLPLAGNQLAALPEFDTIFQNSQSSIHTQTQSINTNGNYQINVALPGLSKTFGFNLGLDAFLQATAVGNVHAAIQPTLNVGFNYTNGVVSLNAAQTNLNVGFDLSLPGFQGTFSFNGLLFTKAVDAGTNFHGDLMFSFAAGNALSPHFSGEAHVLLGLSLSFVDPAQDVSFNPTFHTTLDLDWSINPANNQMLPPSIQLVNFGLDANSFLDGFLGDVVKTVQKFTKPIQPFVDIFLEPVPIISAFGSSETIGTLILKGAGSSQVQQDSFKLMMQIINAVNFVDFSGDTGGAVIPFGTITLTGNAQQVGQFGFNTSQLSGAIDDILGTPALQDLENAITSVGNYAGLNSSAGFKFPLLENPQSVVAGILLGQPDTTLFSFTTGRQHFELSPSIGIGIPGLFGIFLSAGVVFDANLTMGYDTAGLIALAQDPQHDPSHLLHGFYFDNSIDTSVPPRPNSPPVRKTGLYLQGLMELSVDVVVVHASGGIYANLSVELANTDASQHVHLDTMISNLASGGKVFKLGGKVYASADISLELSLPVGPDITLFSYNLGYIELLNFDPPPPPVMSPPPVIHDVADQHTLLLDASKMTAGSRVTVQPFHNLSLLIGGNVYDTDGIRVDYPGETHLYIERKDDVFRDYYNLIAIDGTTPDGVSIDVVDPFRVFADEGAANPYPPQTKPTVMLVGGKDVNFKYSEAANGTKPNVFLAGGYGLNTLIGGTMAFGNFIPSSRVAQAHAYFGDRSGFDGAGQGLINGQIANAVPPTNPAGVIGSTLYASHGGLMVGGPGNNSFYAQGPGAYEMVGGPWVDSFVVSPSFNGVAATYQIDGGPGGQNSLVVRVPGDENIVFENSIIVDKYNSTLKALAVQANAGLSATAHGITKVHIVATAGSSIELGDTSELDIEFSIEGASQLKLGGTSAPDVFSIISDNNFYGTRNHRYARQLVGRPYWTTGFYNGSDQYLVDFENDIDNDVFSIMPPGQFGYNVVNGQYVNVLVNGGNDYIPGPFYEIVRTFGTTGKVETIDIKVGDVGSTSFTLDGKGAHDTYNISQGLGSFIDIVIDDSDTATQNTLNVDFRHQLLLPKQATLTNNSLRLDYFTPMQHFVNLFWNGVSFNSTGYHFYTTSVAYNPTVTFGSNVDITFRSGRPFQRTIINRPSPGQNQTVAIVMDGILDPYEAPGMPTGWYVAYEGNQYHGLPPYDRDYFIPNILTIAYDVEHPEDGIIDVNSSFYQSGNGLDWNYYLVLIGAFGSRIDVLANAGTLSIQDARSSLNIEANTGAINIVGHQDAGIGRTVNIFSNHGQIAYHTTHFASFSYDILNVYENAGTISVDHVVNGSYNGFVQNLSQVLNVLGNAGIINLHHTLSAFLVAYFADAQVNIGNNGSLANIHGTINFSNYNSRYGLKIDDRNNPGTPGEWVIDQNQTRIGSLTLNYPGINAPAPYLDIFSKYQVFPKVGSSVTLIGAPPFYVKEYNGGSFPALAFGPGTPGNQFNRDGDMVHLALAATGNEGQTVSWAASGLPPGLSINQAGLISGTIQPQAYHNSPYATTLTITAGGFTRGTVVSWYIDSGITIDAPIPSGLLGHEGMFTSLGPISTTNNFSLAVMLSVTGLPPGLLFDANTATISGTVGSGAAQNGPYHVTIQATDGTETAEFPFDWPVTGITLVTPTNQVHFAGSSVNLAIQGSIFSGLPLTFAADGLPNGLSIEPTSGVITGVITDDAVAIGVHYVVITASQGNDSMSTYFYWSALPADVTSVVNIVNPGTQTSRELDYGYLSITASSSLSLPLTITFNGLPPGLSPNSGEGSGISGSIDASAAINSPYNVIVTASDGLSSKQIVFDWVVEPLSTIEIYSPGSPVSLVGESVEVSIFAVTTLPNPLAYSATGLPTGLSIQPQTGIISGTISALAALPSVFSAKVIVTDGTSTNSMTFQWNVWSHYEPNMITLPNLVGGGTIDLISPIGTTLTASTSTTAGVTPPSGIQFPFGFLNFTISDLAPGAATTLTIVGLNLAGVTDYYKYGATPANHAPHWYNFLFGVPTDGDSAIGTGMEIVGSNLVLHLKDGGRGDDDMALNGVIYDIGGPAFAQAVVVSGDFDNDGDVDGADFVAWQTHFPTATGATLSDGDADSDGDVDGADFVVWQTNFPYTPAPGLAALATGSAQASPPGAESNNSSAADTTRRSSASSGNSHAGKLARLQVPAVHASRAMPTAVPRQLQGRTTPDHVGVQEDFQEQGPISQQKGRLSPAPNAVVLSTLAITKPTSVANVADRIAPPARPVLSPTAVDYWLQTSAMYRSRWSGRIVNPIAADLLEEFC